MRFLLVATAVATGTLAARQPALPEQTAVAIRTFQFAPDTVRVKLGDSVVWTNGDEIEHTVTAGEPGSGHAFDRALKGKGTTFTMRFDRPGTFAYYCDRHQFMRGAITVTR